MYVHIDNWSLQKAGNGDDKYLPIRCVANRLITDTANDEVLPVAFNKATVGFFLQNGIFDWHHESMFGATPAVRAMAILGRPRRFEWELEKGEKLPVVYGDLTRAHEIVEKAIAPHLESGQDVLCASIGGKINKAEKTFDHSSGGMKRQISGIHWNHLAIAGRPYVISLGSEVSMAKAQINGMAEIDIRYLDVGSLIRNFSMLENEEAICKALEVGAGTNIATLTGMDAMRAQTTDGSEVAQKKKKKKQTEELVKDIHKALRENVIYPTRDGLKMLLKANHGYTEAEAEEFTSEFVIGLPKILQGRFGS